MQIHNATTATAAVLLLWGSAQAANQEFKPPVRVLAGEAFLGEERLYPSPVVHDVDGDGRLDLLVGDLWGRITVALGQPGDGTPTYGAENPLLAADGEELKFNNW